MPISSEEWNKGRTADTTVSLVENFLSKNRGQAFTNSEILHGLYNFQYDTVMDWIGNFLTAYSVSEALKVLMKEGRVRAKIVKLSVGEDTYYSLI